MIIEVIKRHLNIYVNKLDGILVKKRNTACPVGSLQPYRGLNEAEQSEFVSFRE